MIKVKFCFLLVLLSTVLLGQNNNEQKSFHPGYIITNDNIIIKGFIDISGMRHSPDNIRFRETDTSRILIFLPSAIMSFRYDDDYYVSATVNADMSPSSPEELLKNQFSEVELNMKTYFNANNISKQKIVPTGDVYYKSGDSTYVLKPFNTQLSVFLKTLVSGTLNLYYFRDSLNKEHFYIGTEIGINEELNRMFYADIDSRSIPNYNWGYKQNITVYVVEFFKSQLINYMAGDISFKDRVLEMSFTRHALIDLIKDYNSSTSQDGEIYVEASRGNKYKYGFTGGAGVVNLSYSGSRSLGKVDFGYDPVFMAGGNFEIIFFGAQQKLSLNTDLTLRYSKSAGKNTRIFGTNDYSSTFEIISFRVNPSVRYRILTGQITPFLSIGYLHSFFLKDENTLTTIDNTLGTSRTEVPIMDPKKTEQGFTGGLGMMIRDISLEARYERGNGDSSYMSLGSSSSIFFLAFSYSF